MSLRAYACHDGMPEEAAVLVFARNRQEAKKIFWKQCGPDFVKEFIDVRVQWLKGDDFLFEQADQAKLADGIAHVIDDPKVCFLCRKWGLKLQGGVLCDDCMKVTVNPGLWPSKGITHAA